MGKSKRRRSNAASVPKATGAGPRPVQSPKPRPARRSRRGMIGLITTVFLVAVAAVAGLLLARNSATRNFSVGGQQIALPREGPSGTATSVKSLGPAPRFSIKTLAGNTFSLERGRGPVVLSFIAGWCASCVPEAEAGGEIVRNFGKQGVRVLAIDADPNDSLGQLRQFIEAAGNPPIQFAMDRTSEVTLAYKVRALDTTIIIDRKGRMVYRDEWPTDYATLESVVKRIVGAPAQAAKRMSPAGGKGG